MSNVFNVNNQGWRTKFYPLFFGEDPAIHDSVNVTYPKIQTLYKKQIAQRWVEDEFNHDQSRLDLAECPKAVRDIMLRNLAFQWSLDSVASRSIAVLFAPFVSNSELWAALVEITNMEVVHALTYSEIIRQCLPNPDEVFELVYSNDAVTSRMETVSKAFTDLKIVGAKITLDLLNRESDEAKEALYIGWAALYILERIQFATSFPCTFVFPEQGYFQSFGKAIQKITIDELDVHAELDREVTEIEMKRNPEIFKKIQPVVIQMLEECMQKEYAWSKYMFSEGRSIVGLTETLLNEEARYNAQSVYDTFGIELPWDRIQRRPLPWMNNWIDIDKTQNANQEADNNNYALNMIVDDLGDDVIEF